MQCTLCFNLPWRLVWLPLCPQNVCFSFLHNDRIVGRAVKHTSRPAPGHVTHTSHLQRPLKSGKIIWANLKSWYRTDKPWCRRCCFIILSPDRLPSWRPHWPAQAGAIAGQLGVVSCDLISALSSGRHRTKLQTATAGCVDPSSLHMVTWCCYTLASACRSDCS